MISITGSAPVRRSPTSWLPSATGCEAPAIAILYRTLRDQYEQCMQRYGQGSFSSYLFMSQLDYP